MQFLRGKRLVNLVNQNDSAATKTVTDVLADVEILGTSMDTGSKNRSTIAILEDKCAILDERTGFFIFKKYPCQEPQKQQQISVLLDEKSGLLIPANSHDTLSLSSQSDFSISESEYDPYESDSQSSDDGHASKLLDESSGLVKMKRARKGQGNKQYWARNRLQRKRMRGQEYSSIKRKKNEGNVGTETRKPRTLQPRCHSETCAKKFGKQCNEITEAERKKIFEAFWCLTWEEKKAFVIAMISLKQVKASTTGNLSRRAKTLHYTLKVTGEIKVVCKKMFLRTLCLGEWSVLKWVKSSSDNNDIGLPKKTRPVKRQKAMNITKVNHIHKFLEALPRMPSHYCRQSTSKEYIDVHYKTWAELYIDFKKYLSEQDTDEAETPTYKCFLDAIHKTNLSIYRPKKDQCDLCFAYKNKNVSDNEYQEHIKSKERARQEKANDKERCLDDEIHMFTVDLQAVQTIPLISAGANYFKMKLSVHQFTIYNELDKSVVCYVWHEAEAGMDAHVFTSCLLDFLEKIQNKSKPIIIYSDGCCAQNRNTTLANALQHYAISHNVEIYQKYLVVGHTQMECDSVHATIERKKKGRDLYVPADFITIIKEARLSQPYQVRYLNHTFFRDFSSLTYLKSIRPGIKKGDPCVVNLRALKYSSDCGVQYKLSFDDQWSFLPHRITRQQQLNSGQNTATTGLYNHRLAITKRKYGDLQDLKRMIPADYHSFYDDLPQE